MTYEREDLVKFRPVDGRLDVIVANGAQIEVGDVRLDVGGGKTVVVTGVLLVPELYQSCSQFPR